MKLYIASDHAGIELKSKLLRSFPIGKFNFEWVDLGPHSTESVDYPKYAGQLVQSVLAEHSQDISKEELLKPRGVLICGSGVGMSIAANRYKGIRAVLALRKDIAQASREHNASNILCLGSRFISAEEAIEILATWLQTPFAGDRHLRRVKQMDEGRIVD